MTGTYVVAGDRHGNPVVQFLAGAALMDLDRPAEAAQEFQRAAKLDRDDAETHVSWALALYRACCFEESRTAALRAQELDPNLADAPFVLGVGSVINPKELESAIDMGFDMIVAPAKH